MSNVNNYFDSFDDSIPLQSNPDVLNDHLRCHLYYSQNLTLASESFFIGGLK
jgi:hypothetical protein